MTEMSPAEFAAAQEKNYSQWVAKVPIYVQGALAYNPGSPVSAASVEDGTVSKDLVVAADDSSTELN